MARPETTLKDSLCRVAGSVIVAVLLAAEGAACQSPETGRSHVALSFVAGAADGQGEFDQDVNGPHAGVNVGYRFGTLEWDVLRATAMFPSRGGYVNVGTGLSYHSEMGPFVALAGGVSRFSFSQPFASVRLGVPLSVGAYRLAVEANGTRHWRDHGRVGSSFGLGVQLPLTQFF